VPGRAADISIHGRGMNRIADLLDRDFSRPVEDVVKVDGDDPDAVFSELTEYVATDRIRAGYEYLLSAMAASRELPDAGIGLWISGSPGSGKSSFARNLGYVLANREVSGAPASALFLKQMESSPVTGYVEFLNRAVPYEAFLFGVRLGLPAQTSAEQIAELMYQVLLRDLDYAPDPDILEFEIQLEKDGTLAAFQNLCLTEYGEEWRKIRHRSQNLARSSTLLHRLDPRTYPSADAWLNQVRARPSQRLSVAALVARLFDLCEVRRPGKSFVFILDELNPSLPPCRERIESLCDVVGRIGKESVERRNAGKIPGSAWIVVTGGEKLKDVCNRLAGHTGMPKLQECFKHQVDLSTADMAEVAIRRVLRKKESQELILRQLFRNRGAALNQNVSLERCSRRTGFDEDQFVRYYPFLPHLIDLSIDIVTGIRLHPDSPKQPPSGSGNIVTRLYEMLMSDRTRLADQPVGALVSIDRIYELLEESIPPAKRRDIHDIWRRFDNVKQYPAMAARVAKAVCLMEFARTDLPPTTKNIAALLVQRVSEAPSTPDVAVVLDLMKEAQLARETEDGWKLYDFDELRRASAALEGLGKAVGVVNPRPRGWRNALIQLGKGSLARMLSWYTRPLREFNVSASRSIEEIVRTLYHLSANRAASGHRSPDVVALEERLAQSEKKNAAVAGSVREEVECLREQLDHLQAQLRTSPAGGTSWFHTDPGTGKDRTAYVIGLFGSGRWYINEQLLRNIGERANCFRDTIRLHPGPTSMIYSGHTTLRYASSLQYPPAITTQILESVRSGFADMIFVYRHPLDSLLTNWVWWRTHIRENRMIAGISQVYRNTDDLCDDLEDNFSEFEAFAQNDPAFFAALPQRRFLSFTEFVEETELHLRSASLSLRLEDFMNDPLREFSKIAEIMSVDLDLSCLCVAPPRTKPYVHLTVKDKVPRFRRFIDGLDLQTVKQIREIGYEDRL
jgi:hypothetical protein